MATNTIPQALLKQARKSGALNLTNRGLSVVPSSVWKLNFSPNQSNQDFSSFDSGDNWWDQVELTKLNLSSNEIASIPEDIINFRSLTILDLHDNKLTELPCAIAQLTNLKKVDLSHNCLKAIPDFAGMNGLSILLLHYNQISDLSCLKGALHSCETLDISHNLVTYLPSALNCMECLRSLNLSHNQLTELPLVDNLNYLKMLNLNNNRLKLLPSGIGKLPHLEQLYIRNNFIEKFPSLMKCLKLKEIYAGNNALTELPDNIPPCVAVLELRDNKISTISPNITKISSLERLDIANNNVTKLPPEIGNMSHIKVLNLDGNPMRSIRRDIISQGSQAIIKHLKSRIVVAPESGDVKSNDSVLPQSDSNFDLTRKHNIVSTCKLKLTKQNQVSVEKELKSAFGVNLLEIVVSQCSLSSMPCDIFSFSSSLSTLDVSSNKLAEIPIHIGELTLLTHLNLSSNNLISLPTSVTSLQLLIDLNISSNRFSELPRCLFDLTNLEHLLADSNQLSIINMLLFKKLVKLSTLSLQNNNIGQIPPELSLLSKLQTLKLEGNVFRVPRQSIVQKGSAAVLEYLRSRVPT